AVFELITLVGLEFAIAWPSAFVAVTTTRAVWSTSAATRMYIFFVAVAMSTQLDPSALQRCHWYENEVGLFVQIPFCAVSVLPCSGVPAMVGWLVFTGAAASAEDVPITP